MNDKLRVKLLAFPAADTTLFTRAKKRLSKLFHQDRIEFVSQQPDILVFLTGGSERAALHSLHRNSFYLMIASSIENSWAAATEVKAWMNQNGISSLLIDENDAEAHEVIEALYRVKNGLRRLNGKKFGLIGKPSEWLVASVIDPFIIQSKLGVEQIDLPWEMAKPSNEKEVASDFMNFFKTQSNLEVHLAGRVYESLVSVIRCNDLSALTIECFPLAQKCNTTACLALSKLSMDGIPAGCEGDTCSMIGMMISKEIFGIVPWMANVANVNNSGLLLAHCTVPANMLTAFSLETHFETDMGVAIKGEFRYNEVTLFRVDNNLSRLFAATARVIPSKYVKDACRTQVTFEIDEKTKKYFLESPLGNHHLVVPSNRLKEFWFVAKILGMEIIPEFSLQ